MLPKSRLYKRLFLLKLGLMVKRYDKIAVMN